jgi:hypothetical protein
MPELVPLGVEVSPVLEVGIGDERNALHDFEAVPLEADQLEGLLVITRMEESPRSRRICAPIP